MPPPVGLGISASFAYDNLGQLSSRTDPNSNTWTVKDDNSGRVASITDPLNRTTSYTYDVRNRVSGSTNPLGSVQIGADRRRERDAAAILGWHELQLFLRCR